MHKSRVLGNIVPEFVDGVNYNKELFLDYSVVEFHGITAIVNSIWIVIFVLSQHHPNSSI